MNVREAVSLVRPVASARFLGSRIPLVVGIQLTLRCNYRCDYCTRHSDQRVELPFELVHDLLGEIARLGGRKVVFTGGEPLLYPRVGELAEHGRDLGLSVGLNTNGTYVARNEDLLDVVADLTTSLDGGRELHDRVRGPGSFDRVVDALGRARAHGLRTRVTVVLHRESIGEIDELLELGRRESTPIMFQPVFDPPSGRGDLHPEPEAYRGAIDRLLEAKRGAYPDVVANSPEGLAYIRQWPDLPWARCAGGFLFCRVQVNGDVVICAENTLAPPSGNLVDEGAGAFERIFRGLEVLKCGTCPCSNHVEINEAFAPALGPALNLLRLV